MCVCVCVCVNAIRTILQFTLVTLVTHGHLFRVRLGATKGTNIPIITYNILIIIVLLCRCGPYMCRYVFPRTIWRVPYLSLNQKLLQMQEYAHVLMQLCTGSPPYVLYDAPVPHACKQVLNTCPIETMNIIVLLLPLGQRLSTDKWPCHMEAPFVCIIHGANLIIHKMPLAPFWPFAIPNEKIRQCPRGHRTNPNDVAQAVNGNCNFVYAPGVFRIKQDITKDASYGRNGHVIHVVCHEMWKVSTPTIFPPIEFQRQHHSSKNEHNTHLPTKPPQSTLLLQRGDEHTYEGVPNKGDKIRSQTVSSGSP